MELSFLFAIATFAFVMSVTPGPNNIMLLASGAQHGFLRTMPHMLGILSGMVCMNISVLMGLGALFQLYPILYDILKVGGSLYLLWLAWKIANSSTNIQGVMTSKDTMTKEENSKPMTWLAAGLFQFVNPKAWTMSIGSMSTFTLAGALYIESGLWVVVAFVIMGFIAISMWAGLGLAIGKWLTTATRQRNFNWMMGLITAASLALILV